MTLFEIPGRPIPWMRARRKNNRYFDAQADKKVAVRHLVRSQMRIKEPISEPIKLTIEFHMSVPTSWAKKRRESVFKTPHRPTPDLDNMVKFICDALNKVLWVDDSLIYEIHSRKFYSFEPKTVFSAEPYNGKRLYSLLEVL